MLLYSKIHSSEESELIDRYNALSGLRLSDPDSGTGIPDNSKSDNYRDSDICGNTGNASCDGATGNNDEDEDNDDGVVDGPAIFAHTKLAKTVSEYNIQVHSSLLLSTDINWVSK